MEETIDTNSLGEKNAQTEVASSSSDTYSDELLLAAIAGRAVWAMELLYDRYNRLFYSLAYHMVEDHQAAEDLTQDVFLAIWQRAHSYSPQTGPARPWIIAIAHHRTIDYLRAVRRRSLLKETPLEDSEVDDHAAFPDVWDEAWQSLQHEQVKAALMHIPIEQRLVIELAYFQGWTHSEIAREYEIPLGTVKARMRLGLNHLKRVLEEMGVTEM